MVRSRRTATAAHVSSGDEVQAFSVRLPREEHRALRVYATVTGQSMNDVVNRAIREFLTSSARREEVDALMDDVIAEYHVVLEKLADL